MGYKEGGSIGDVKPFMEDIEQISQVPGGIDMLMTMAAEELGGAEGGKTKQLRLYEIGGAVEYNEGGLAEAAQTTQRGGRGDDSMMLHLSPEEYEAITSMWGEPDINPNTGIPEYGFLSKLWKGIKKVVKKIVKSPLFSFIAPIALNFFVPGAGLWLGKAIGAGANAALVGNTLIRAGIGGVAGGKEGALAGAVSGLTMGGAGAKLGAKLGLEGTAAKYAGNAIIGGAGSSLGGGEFGTGAFGSVLNTYAQPKLEAAVEGALGTVFPGQGGGGKEANIPPGSMTAAPTTDPFTGADTTMLPQTLTSGAMVEGVGGTPPAPGFLSRAGDWIKENPMLAAAGAAGIYGATTGGGETTDQPPQLPSEFTEGLPPFEFNREQQPLMPIENYYTYGQQGAEQMGEHQFFSPNALPSPEEEGASGMGQPLPGLAGIADPNNPQFMAMMAQMAGGAGRQFAGGGYAQGAGSGRDDTIEALLSDGEYVMDAETVSLLGDGSNDAGAERLDEMREELRRHKGRGLSKGKFSADARRPMQYLKKGGYAHSSKYRKGGNVISEKKVRTIVDDKMDRHIRHRAPQGHGVRAGVSRQGRFADGGQVSNKRIARAMARAVRGEA